MFKSMGLTSDGAANMAKALTSLAYDMASFYNLKPEEAFLKLQSGITGEAEPLKRLGILINEATVKTYALKHGIGEQGKALTELEKVYARYFAILDQTKLAQGDLLRTGDSLTNVFRTIWNLIKQTGTEIGTAFLPAITELGIAFRDYLINNKEDIINFFRQIPGYIKNEFIPAIIRLGSTLKQFAKDMEPLLSLFKLIGGIHRGLGKTVKYVAPAMRNSFIENGGVHTKESGRRYMSDKYFSEEKVITDKQLKVMESMLTELRKQTSGMGSFATQ